MKLILRNPENYKKIVEALNSPDENIDFSAIRAGPEEFWIHIFES